MLFRSVGINYTLFTKAVIGTQELPVKWRIRFIEVFREMDIEKKTADFKESNNQLWLKSHWRGLKNTLTMLVFSLIMSTMKINSASFLNTSNINCREYLVTNRVNSALKPHNAQAEVVSYSLMASAFFCVFVYGFSTILT